MQWRNMIVGVWSYNTWLNSNVANNQRMLFLEQAVAKLKDYRDTQIKSNEPKWQNADGRPSMAFIAPEYMFAQPTPNQYGHQFMQERFVGENDKNKIVSELTNISEKYGKSLILAPGSIAYKVPLNEARYQKAIKDINSGRDLLGLNDNDPVTASPWVHHDPWTGNKTPYSALSSNTKKQDLLIGKTGTGGFIAKNTVFAFNRGKIIADYTKRTDFHEVLNYGAGTHTQFVPGVTPGRMTVGGVTFGAEICYDHNRSILKNTPTIDPKAADPEVHLLCSAYVDFKADSSRMRVGGYVAHGCNQHVHSGVWRKSPNAPHNVVPVAGKQIAKIGGGELDVYEIEVKMAF